MKSLLTVLNFLVVFILLTSSALGKVGEVFYQTQPAQITRGNEKYLTGKTTPVEMYDEIETYSNGKVSECILAIADGQYQDVQVVDKEINFMSTITKILRIIR